MPISAGIASPSARRPDAARQAAEIAGRRAETLAAWYLRLKGYRIIESRYKTPVGEIDLIARRWGTTVFVEVKARKSAALELTGVSVEMKVAIEQLREQVQMLWLPIISTLNIRVMYKIF